MKKNNNPAKNTETVKSVYVTLKGLEEAKKELEFLKKTRFKKVLFLLLPN